MYDFFEIENDQLLIKKWHKGNLITLYLKIEGINMNLINVNAVKKISSLTKQLTFTKKKGCN